MSKELQFIFLIHGVVFANSVNLSTCYYLLVTPKSVLGALSLFPRCGQSGGDFDSLDMSVSICAPNSATLPCASGAAAAITCPPHGLSGATPAFLHFLLVMSVLEMAPKCRAKVLASVPKVEEAVICVL